MQSHLQAPTTKTETPQATKAIIYHRTSWWLSMEVDLWRRWRCRWWLSMEVSPVAVDGSNNGGSGEVRWSATSCWRQRRVLTAVWRGGEWQQSKDRRWWSATARSVTAPREKEHVKEKLKMTETIKRGFGFFYINTFSDEIIFVAINHFQRPIRISSL